jgi:hypothetical protein
MPMDPRHLDRDVIDDVRIACERSGRPTDEAEVRRALQALPDEEIEALGRIARSPLAARPLSPHALIDIVHGTPPMKAAAREVGGYYELLAERDALATIARQPRPAEPQEEADEAEPDDEALDDAEEDGVEGEQEDAAPPEAFAERLQPVRARRAPARVDAPGDEQQRETLMTLFAYHRDAVRVAQELGINVYELNAQVDTLGLKRQIHRLLEATTDIQAFRPERMSGSKSTTSTPVVRRRTERASPPVEPEPAKATPSREPSAPTVDTAPVNTHGTRVYRREPPVKDPLEGASGLGSRREYVRESRRRSKPDRAPAPPAPKPPEAPKPSLKRPFSELQAPGGSAILNRLIGDEKANPRVLSAKLAERYDGAAARDLSESDLRALLQHHGLADTFREREVANTRFLIGFHQGARGKLANALQMTPEDLTGYLSKLSLTDDLERTRSERSRIELGRRKIGDRIVQVLTRAPYLDDLGVLGPIDREVHAHIEQLFEQHTGPDASEDVRSALAVEKNAFAKLLRRYGLAEKAPGSTDAGHL